MESKLILNPKKKQIYIKPLLETLKDLREQRYEETKGEFRKRNGKSNKPK